MRNAFAAGLVENEEDRAERAETRIADLEEEVRRIAGSRSLECSTQNARGERRPKGLGTLVGGMWMYLVVAAAILVTINVLIVLVVAVLARHAQPGEELSTGLGARIERYVRRAA
jgi:hypothetical protein